MLVLATLVLAVASAKLAWAGTVLARQRARIPVAEIGRAIAARLAPGEPWILIGPYRSWWHFSVNRPCLSVPEWKDLPRVRAEAHGSGARFVLARAETIPSAGDAPERVESWLVDGVSYCLVRLP